MGRTDLVWRGHTGTLGYRYWHPRDHIHFGAVGTPGPGCRFRIVEAFQADPRYLSDRTFRVPKLDASGFRLELRLMGVLVASSAEDFSPAPDGMRYKVTLTLGLTHRWIQRLVRPAVDRFVREGARARIRHNVEEVGNLPHFLPELHASNRGRGNR